MRVAQPQEANERGFPRASYTARQGADSCFWLAPRSRASRLDIQKGEKRPALAPDSLFEEKLEPLEPLELQLQMSCGSSGSSSSGSS